MLRSIQAQRSNRGAVSMLWTAALLGGCLSGARSGGLPPDSTTQLEVTHRVDHLGGLAREPMVAEHPNGTLFVSGYGGLRPNLWRSGDRGATWTRVGVGTEAQGAIGNSDVDLAVAADGTLYYLNMLYDRSASEGRQIAIGVSRDVGATWAWKTISKVRYDDRPWVDVAPDGTAHIIWNDGSGVSHVMTPISRISFPPVYRRTHVGMKRGTVSCGTGSEVGPALVQQARVLV